MSTIIAEDVARLLACGAGLWNPLRGASLFITGGTGFFGIWLLETLLAANRELSLGMRVAVLSRDPAGFAARAPHLTVDPSLRFVTGDVRDFPTPHGDISHVIHAATEASASLNAADPQTMFDVCAEGTRRVLALAVEKRAARMLFTSSGAVYGRQPPGLANIPEDFPGGPDPLSAANAYAEGKRAAEMLCGLAVRSNGLPVTVARCFAFVGPHLPLGAHFAIGNFIRDAIAGGPIRIAGDGTAWRSYLYASDLIEWLLTVLDRGAAGRAYNVGGSEAVSIRQLAERVASVAGEVFPDRPQPVVVQAGKPVSGGPAERYVPCCLRAERECGLTVATPLGEAIRRTMLFHSGCE